MKSRVKKAKPARRVATKAPRVSRPSAVSEATEVARLTRERDEALDRQQATADVLHAIATTPGDAEGTLRKIAETAARLFGAAGVSFRLAEGDQFKLMVSVGQGAEEIHAVLHKDPAKRSTVRSLTLPGTVVRENRQIHFPDLDHLDDVYADWPGLPIARRAGIRTMVGTPLRANDRAIGALLVYRNVLRPFEATELALLQSFAVQAAIAIENARLLSELRQRTDDLTESLEQQTATSEVLRVISSSPGELEPVFASMLENAVRICDARFGNIYRWTDGVGELVAAYNTPPALAATRQRSPLSDRTTGIIGRMRESKSTVHITDLTSEQYYLERSNAPTVAAVELGGVRTIMAVPMLKDDELIGSFTLYRQQVRPFTDKQIALVTSFSRQAVIAIENTRLLTELRELLEQQTATSDVLRVISSSPGDLRPVFQAIIANAVEICAAKNATLWLYESGAFRAVARHLDTEMPLDVMHPGPKSGLGRLETTKQTVHIADYAAEPAYAERDHFAVTAVERFGVRSSLSIPLLKEGHLVGAISIFRGEVRPFADKQIELIENFAAQAVIAIENARLLTELRESLDQQTAMADVLRVISTSPGDLKPVFSAMLENATRLCDANFGVLPLYEGGEDFRIVAMHNVPPAFAELRQRSPVFRTSRTTRLATTKQFVHVSDILIDDEGNRDPAAAAFVKLTGARSLLLMPMLKEGDLVGAIAIYRLEVRPFTDKQIDLVKNFAAQAVIAIENARLLSELRESLAQQTATSEVLQVISRSPGDLEPVFSTMLDNAVRICGASFGTMLLFEEGGLQRRVAMHNVPPAYLEFSAQNPVVPSTVSAVVSRVRRTRQAAHVVDLLADDPNDPLAKFAGARSVVTVPMLKDNEAIGIFGVFRQEVRPFTAKQLELLQNFAAQAVIAIENARLLTELRESLEQQTATADVLRVISSSPGDLQPVFGKMLENAIRISGASFGIIHSWDGENLRLLATHNLPPALDRARRDAPAFKPGPKSGVRRMAATKRVIHIHDLREDEGYLDKPSLQIVEPRRAGRANDADRADVEGRRGRRHLYRLSSGSAGFHRQANRSGQELCRSGRHRHRECTAADGIARVAGAADGDRRCAQRHLQVAG